MVSILIECITSENPWNHRFSGICIPAYSALTFQALSKLARLLFHSDVVVLTNACVAISEFCDYKIKAVVDAGVTGRLVELLG